MTRPELAPAHVVLARSSLRQHLQHSAASLVVEFLSDAQLWTAPDGFDHQEYFRVRRLETLAGEATPEAFDFFPHAEGFPAFRKADRALLFLERSAEHPLFVSLAPRFTYFSVQGAGDEWKLTGEAGVAIIELARAYAAWLRGPPEPRSAGLRALLLRELGSGVERLRADAIGELIRLRTSPAVFDSPEAVAPFVALIDAAPASSAAAPAGGQAGTLPFRTRIALVRLFEGAAGFDALTQWRGLATRAQSGADRRALVQAAAAVKGSALSAWLASQLSSDDLSLRRAAAAALGRPWHASQRDALVGALEDPDLGVVRAAIDALGSLGGEQARQTLGTLAAGDDRDRARWAAAALRRLAP